MAQVGIYKRECKNGKPWAASVALAGRVRGLGHFATKEAAEKARRDWVAQMRKAGIRVEDQE